MPTQPLDISEVTEFSAKNTLSSQPPPNVTSTLENIVTSKPSTVSLLRGMRLKKSTQINGAKLLHIFKPRDSHHIGVCGEEKKFFTTYSFNSVASLCITGRIYTKMYTILSLKMVATFSYIPGDDEGY